MIANAAYQIPDANLEGIRAKVAKLGNRCAKIGLPALRLIEHRKDERVRDLGFGRRKVLPCTWVELDGAVPVVAGYEFLARIEHTEAGNMISAPQTGEFGPQLDLTPYRTAKPICDHCLTSRMRKDTFVLREQGTGKIVQIGRNCLADYIRSEDANVAVDLMRLTDEISREVGGCGDDDDLGFGGGWTIVTSTVDFLAAACAEVRKHGFKPTSFENSTRARANFICSPMPRGDSYAEIQEREDWIDSQPTDEDCAKAVTVLEWVKAWTDTSDYAHNVRIACALPRSTARHEGILASAVSAYDRAMGIAAKRKIERSASANSEYQGTVGKRQIWTLTVLRRHGFDTKYGTTTINVFADASGNAFVWKQSSGPGLEIGRTYHVTGTVKKHEAYNGVKQTILTRCTTVETNGAEEIKS